MDILIYILFVGIAAELLSSSSTLANAMGLLLALGALLALCG